MKKIVFLSFSILAFLVVHAAALKPVKWTCEAKKTAVNEYDLVFTAKIDKKWHFYSQFLESDNGPIKTTFTFKDADGYVKNGVVKEMSKGVTAYDKAFAMNVKYFANEAVFIQHVKLTKDIGSISGVLNYQCCDDSKCLPPTDEDFTFNVKYEAQKN